AGVPGIGVGPIRRLSEGPGDPVVGGPDQVVAAFDAAAAELRRLAGSVPDAAAEIMTTTALIADDPDLRAAALAHLAAGRAAGDAVLAAADTYAAMLAALPDPTLAARAADVRQVARRVVGRLGTPAPVTAPDAAVIVIGDEVGADDLLEGAVAGAASRLGGSTAHVAIVARALGVPVVFGIDPDGPGVAHGALAIVDGGAATLTVAPGDAELEAALTAARADTDRRRILAAGRDLPAITRDGRRIALLANVATAAESAAAVAGGAEGAGLVRTELPFLDAAGWPTADAHLAALGPVIAGLGGRPATVRTLDFAPDKLPPFLAGRPARRCLALMLAEPDTLVAQFAGTLAAAGGAPLRFLLPMVTAAAELDRGRLLLAAAARRLGVAPPPLGAMVELAAAVDRVDELAEAADFLSIGTNDLVADLLGIRDRTDPRLTPARAAEPVVVAAIGATVRAAAKHHRPVSVCGDAAADPAVVPLLLAAGCDTLSVAPPALDEVRALIRSFPATRS
ncbi:MAG TPA: putative PEP-binding protein, partial [Asanoa sp.]